MRILRRASSDGSVLPPAFAAIAGVPDNYLFHEAHGLKHPLSAYNTSLRLITAQWTKTFDDIDTLNTQYRTEGKDEFMMDVVASYGHLLHRLNEHFDACYSVLRSLSEPPAGKQPLMHPQYLDKVKFVGWKQFRDATIKYRESHLGLIVNSLKHSQGELCPVYFHSLSEFRPGYYLRGLLPGGVLGPDPRLHPRGNTALSFNRDMLVHLWWLYRTSDLLATAMASYLDATYQHKLQPRPMRMAEMNWSRVVQRCAAISPSFFPDEWDQPYPRVIYMPEPEHLSIEFPGGGGVHRLIGEVKVSTLMAVDGAHPTAKMPYLGFGIS